MSEKTAVSVLLPMQEDRHSGLRCLRAWVEGQEADPASYELIVIAPPSVDPALREAAKALLRPQDRWIEHRSENEWELFNAASEHARAPLLFFTEAHCVPEPFTLSEMLAHLAERGGPGARGPSRGESHGRFGALEQLVYEEDLKESERDDHWHQVLIHSLTIRREVFEKVGRFETDLGEFAVWGLAIALNEGGHRLSYAPRALVKHVYTGELDELIDQTTSFGRGEMAYCSRTAPETRLEYFREPEEFTTRFDRSRRGARLAVRTALTARRPWQALRHLPVALAGPVLPRATARLRVRFWHLAVLIEPREAGRLRAYRRLWRASAHAGRLSWVGSEPGDGARLFGIYPSEDVQGENLRWTSPVAAISLPGANGYRVEIDLKDMAGVDPAPKVIVDGVTLEGARDGHISVTVPAGSSWVGISCRPLSSSLKHPSEKRRLGVPLRSLSLAALPGPPRP